MKLKNTGAVYNSFQELAVAYGIKPKKQNEVDLNNQREKFEKKHICQACKQPLSYHGGNILACNNEKCRGLKHEKTNADGTVSIYYTPVYETLKNFDSKLASKIYE